MKTIDCQHWSECGVKGGGCCAGGFYGARPSHGVCLMVCKLGENPKVVQLLPSKTRGFGDTLASLIKRATKKAEKCSKCDKRRQWLNWLVPYRPMREVVMRLALVALAIVVIALLVRP